MIARLKLFPNSVMESARFTSSISSNEPQVKSIAMPKSMMAGFYVIPRFKLEFCNLKDSKYTWFRQILKTDPEYPNRYTSRDMHYTRHFSWMKVAESLVYHPGLEDVGRLLKFRCLPCDGSRVGLQGEGISHRPVELGPGQCPFEKRQEFTKTICEEPNVFRVISYNILADLYASSRFSREILFKQCPAYALHMDYRKQLLYKEIIGYNSDIICLQEVDAKVFRHDLHASLSLTSGEFGGIFCCKGGGVSEGVAMFYRHSRFDLVTSWGVELSKLIDPKGSIVVEPDDPEKSSPSSNNNLSDFSKDSLDNQSLPSAPQPITDDQGDCIEFIRPYRQQLLDHPNLAKRFLNRRTVVQVAILRSIPCPSKHLLVANTHLYFHPDATHIRLLQGSLVVKYIEFLKDYIVKNKELYYEPRNGEDFEISVIFCGDFNSTPDSGLYRLIINGDAPETLEDWRADNDEEVKEFNVTTDIRLKSAYGRYQEPEYTNYTLDFKGCLDYIYYDSGELDCRDIVPLPDHEDVTKYTALPNPVYPSDHLALIADLRWKS